MSDLNFLEKEKGFLRYRRDDCWGGYQVDFDRRTAFINPSIASPVNLGISLLSVEQNAEKDYTLKIKEAFHLRVDKITKRMKDMGKRGIKSLFTKGIRWAIDTAFGIEEDMQTTEFSGVFSFSDPTVISYEAFGVAKDVIMDLSDFEIKLWRMDFNEMKMPLKNTDMAVTVLGGAGRFSDIVVDGLKKVEYSSDEGRANYSALACVANYAWARRQIVKGIMEMSVFDVFGKSVRTRKICDMSLNIVYDNGRSLVYRKNAIRKFSPFETADLDLRSGKDGIKRHLPSHIAIPHLCKYENELAIVDGNGEMGRMVLIDQLPT